MSAESSSEGRGVPWGKIALIGLAVFVGTLTALWFIFVHAPGPEAVCERLTEMTLAEAGDDHPESAKALIERLEARCVDDKRRIIQFRGKIEWAEYARCVMEAEDLATAEAC